MSFRDEPLFLEPGNTPWWSDYTPMVARAWNHRTKEYSVTARCMGTACDKVAGYLALPFCEDCAWTMWAKMEATEGEGKKEAARRGMLNHHRTLEASLAAQNVKLASLKSRTIATTPGTIYYLEVGQLIKIGYTTDMEQRMRQYPPNVTILATHPGTRETERQMHHKFLNRIKEGREWFEDCQEIRNHIADVRKAFPQKVPA